LLSFFSVLRLRFFNSLPLDITAILSSTYQPFTTVRFPAGYITPRLAANGTEYSFILLNCLPQSCPWH
jgi:hypothetical protein